MEKGEEERKCRRKWMELTVDTLLCLSIEILRHLKSKSSADNMTTGACHVITNADHVTIKQECQELIYRNLLEIMLLIDFSQSIYILKELVRLHQKILTYLFHQYDPLPIHSLLLKLFQSNVFSRVIRSWLGKDTRFMSPTELNTRVHVRTLDTTSHATLLHSSTIETNENDLTLESGLISTVMRKGVLLLLRYLGSVLAADKKATSPTWTAGNFTSSWYTCMGEQY